MNGNGARRRLVPGSFGFMSSPTPPSGPSWPDPGVIAQLANALFQASPNASPGLALAPTLPASPPSPTIVPAPSVVTTVAPLAPAQPPVGPPDVPPVTIPSVVPTPTIPPPTAPAALTGVIPAPVSGSPASPPGLPQPGGSPGVILPPVPSLFDLGALPLSLRDLVA